MSREVNHKNLLGRFRGSYYYSDGKFYGTSHPDGRGQMCPCVARDSFARIHDRLWQSGTHRGRFMAVQLCNRTYGLPGVQSKSS